MRSTTQAASAASGDQVWRGGIDRVLVNVTQTNNSICHLSLALALALTTRILVLFVVHGIFRIWNVTERGQVQEAARTINKRAQILFELNLEQEQRQNRERYTSKHLVICIMFVRVLCGLSVQ